VYKSPRWVTGSSYIRNYTFHPAEGDFQLEAKSQQIEFRQEVALKNWLLHAFFCCCSYYFCWAMDQTQGLGMLGKHSTTEVHPQSSIHSSVQQSLPNKCPICKNKTVAISFIMEKFSIKELILPIIFESLSNWVTCSWKNAFNNITNHPR
jgi:hypothetical protein